MEAEETHNNEVTKSKDTVQLYGRIFERLKAHTRADLKKRDAQLLDGEEPPFSAIVITFNEREATWSKSTARLYRVALSFMLQNMGTPDAHEARRLLKRDHISDIADDEQRAQVVEEIGIHDAKVKEARLERLQAIADGELKAGTSGQKAKRLNRTEMDRLIIELKNSRSKFATDTMLWFMSGYLTGLRPAEWGQAELAVDQKDRRVLVVKNAKSTNGRSFGIDRTLRLSHLSDREMMVIEQHSLRARRAFDNEKFESYYDACRFLLLAINTRLWPKRSTHPTLYTARHMFASDAKSMFSKIEVAALMGHGSDKTAGLHYGKRRFARGGVKVEPSDSDVMAVAKLNPISSIGNNFDRDDSSKSTGSGGGLGSGVYR